MESEKGGANAAYLHYFINRKPNLHCYHDTKHGATTVYSILTKVDKLGVFAKCVFLRKIISHIKLLIIVFSQTGKNCIGCHLEVFKTHIFVQRAPSMFLH